jgi:hypothetical protein
VLGIGGNVESCQTRTIIAVREINSRDVCSRHAHGTITSEFTFGIQHSWGSGLYWLVED